MKHTKQITILSWQFFLINLLALIFITSCTVQDPVSIKRKKGNITGQVLPAGIYATVAAVQGVKTVASTTTDSAGYYYIANLTHGVYTLRIEASGYGTQIENEITVYEGGTTAIRQISLTQFPEQILASQPHNNQQEYPLNNPITIEFTQPMDTESVEDAFHVSPMLKGNFYWNSDGTSITFLPEPQLMAATYYQVILSTTAKTRDEIPLSFPYSIGFSTTAVRVIQTSPLNGTTGVLTNSSFMFTFNSVIDKIQLPHSFEIKPEIAGEFKWISEKSFIFMPGSLLDVNTDYQITLDSLLSDVYGKTTKKPFIFYFQTEPARIINTNPQNGADFVSRNTHVSIKFNANMNRTTVENAFQITPNINGVFLWDDNSSVRFVPGATLLPANTYKITLETSAKTLSDQPLSEAFEMQFITAP